MTLYTSALELAPSAILYSNRAAAHLALESCGAALADAEISVQLDPSYTKGYYRRAAAHFLLGKHGEALRDYRLVRNPARRRGLCVLLAPPLTPPPARAMQVAKLKPSDKDAQAKLKECEKVVRALKFASAIAAPEEAEVRCARRAGRASRGASRRCALRRGAGGRGCHHRPVVHACVAMRHTSLRVACADAADGPSQRWRSRTRAPDWATTTRLAWTS